MASLSPSETLSSLAFAAYGSGESFGSRMPPPCCTAPLLPPPEPVIKVDLLKLKICHAIHSWGRGRGGSGGDAVLMLMGDVEENVTNY